MRMLDALPLGSTMVGCCEDGNNQRYDDLMNICDSALGISTKTRK